jgi:hypothetical protein
MTFSIMVFSRSRSDVAAFSPANGRLAPQFTGDALDVEQKGQDAPDACANINTPILLR